MRRLTALLVAVALLLGVTATFALAQVGRTELRGRVTDEQGGVLPGVTVLITNQDDGTFREVISSSDGTYFAAQLLPGTFTVTASLPGFSTSERTDYVLTVGQTTDLDIVLTVGGIEETITVSGQTPLVDLTSAEVGGTVQADELVELPLVNRSAFAAIATLPGLQFNPSASQGNDSIIANGQTGAASTLNTDGANNADSTSAGAGGSQVKVAIESVSEFQVITNQFDAEFGRASGAIINAVTKRGTNQVSGAAFSYNTSTAMTATDYLTQQAGNDKPENSKYEFGGVLGGPVIRDRAHFFTSLERRLTKPGRTRIFNSRPDLNRTSNEDWQAWNYLIRYDQQLSANHSFAVRHLRELSPELDVFASTLRTINATSENDDDEWMVVGSATSVLGNNVVNTFRGMRSEERFAGGASQWVAAGGPSLRTGVMRDLPPGYYTSSYQDNIDTTSGGRDDFQWQFTNTTSWFIPDKMGDHDVKFGGSWNVNEIRDFSENHLGGEFRMASETLPFDVDNLFTYPDRLRVRVGDPNGRFFDYPGDSLELFFQDKWTLNERWTLGLGIRYDAERLHGRLNSNPLMPPGEDPRDWDNFSPRLSVAYDVEGDGRSVMRVGYGRFYDRTLLSGLDNVLQDPAVQTSFDVTFPRNFNRDPNPRLGLPATDPELIAATIIVRPGDPLFSQCPPATGNPTNGCVLVNHDWIAANFSGAEQLNQARVYLDNERRNQPWFHQFTVGYERELMPTLSVSADYIMMRGRDLLNRINYLAPFRHDGMSQSDPLTFYDVGGAFGGQRVEDRTDTVFYPGGAMDPRTGFPLAGTFINRVLSIESVGRSSYDALNLAVEKRYSDRWGARLSYAWGHSHGNSFEQYGTNGPSLDGVQSQVLGELNMAENWQDAETDRRHILTLSGNTELPGGITAAAILRYMTELPFTIYNSTIDINQNGSLWDPLPPGMYTGTGANPITVEQTRGACELINAVGCQAAARSADYLQLDLRFGYRVRPRADETIDIYLDVINLTNRTNWNPAQGNQNSGSFLNYTSLRGGGFPRQANFGLRYGF